MRTRSFGALGTRVPVIGQGTWYLERCDRATAIAALQRGIDLGMTHVDTAEMYGHGRVEEIVGEAIRGRREEVFLVSKVLPSNASRKGVIRACEASLRRLGTDHLDVYLLHWPGRYPLADTIASFEELREAGKTRAWGVSNFDEEDLAEVLELAAPERIACNQVLHHLGERHVELGVAPMCEDRGIPVVAYSPFGSGRFPAARSGGGRVLAEVAGTLGVTPRQVALAFLVRRAGTFTIPKAARMEHVEENAAAGDLELPDDALRLIDTAFPARRRPELPII